MGRLVALLCVLFLLYAYCRNAVLSSGQQYQLLDWLANVTFPREAKFKDTDYAHKEYSRVVRTTIDCGVSSFLFIYIQVREVISVIDHNMLLLWYHSSRGHKGSGRRCR